MKVKTAFTDRDTGQTYQPGDIYRGTEARLQELRDGGYLTKQDVPDAEPVVEEPAPEPAPTPTTRRK